MTYFNKAKRLAKEFFAFKTYKQMHIALAIFVGLFLFPFIVAFLVFLLYAFILAILFSFFEAPIKFLHNIVSEEGRKTRPATEFIIYFISWPLVFLFYVLYALSAFFFVIVYFFAAVFGYIASLCGYRFHVSPFAEDISRPESDKKYLIQSIVFIVFCLLLFVTLGIVAGSIYSSLYYRYEEYLFPMTIYPVLIVFQQIYIWFAIIYIPIVYHGPKQAEVVIEEEPKEEK